MSNKRKTMKWAKFCGWLLRRLGWKSDSGPVEHSKAVILGVPHTSIWDFLISYLYYAQFGKVVRLMVKKEFFFWPMGSILRACGAVPVDRSNATTMVKSLIEQMEQADEFVLALAPEGTRKPVARWKTGYHLIARHVGCPVYLGFFDWGTKTIGRGEVVELTDDARADTDRIQAIYREMKVVGKHPEKFIA